MSQLVLPLSYRSADGESDFYISAANAEAVGWLDRWPDWPGRTLMLVGPPGSGKSHLLRIFARRAGEDIAVFDDAERPSRDETAIFHAWNTAHSGGPGLLLAARAPPAAWQIGLPDLRSRLRSLSVAEIAPPDDALLAELLAKHFRDRGLLVSPDVIDYMVPRIERSFAGALAAVNAVDVAALAGRRPVTVPLTREALQTGYEEDCEHRAKT